MRAGQEPACHHRGWIWEAHPLRRFPPYGTQRSLVEGDARYVGAVSLAAVEVAHLGPPAVHYLHAARGVEEDAPVGQVAALVVGYALAARQLAHLARGEAPHPQKFAHR